MYSVQDSVFTFEDYQRMMKLENWLVDNIMPVYREQIDEHPERYLFLLINGEVSSKAYRFIRLSVSEND